MYDCKIKAVEVFNEEKPYWWDNKEERKCCWECPLAKSWIKMFIKPLTPGASRRKLHFLLILEISCLEMAKLAPIYSKRHLQHDSMPFLPLAPRFFFRLFRFLLFLSFCSSNWTCFQFKTFWESIIEADNFYYGVAKCSRRKVLSNFQTFSCIFQASLTPSLWSRYQWKDLYLLICRTWVQMKPILGGLHKALWEFRKKR